jgi:4-hydroxyphenylacetate 3-monooxygenase
MILSGREKLARMRDGRRIFVGSQRIDDVTSHPAFRRGADTVAALYDAKAPYTFEEDGERFGLHWLRCRTAEDLRRRSAALKAIADASYGLIGRSPDHVAGMVTGLATRPQMFEALRKGAGEALTAYYDYARRNDLYLCFAVTPPAGIRSTELFPGQERDDPRLRVVAEDEGGVVVSGMKMLATSAAYADEVWIGNLTPIDDKYRAESITGALPLNAPGVSLWARQPYAAHARAEADYPLSWRFDEGDCVLVCENVRLPWSRVFLHDDAHWSRRIYIESAANAYANHQSNVRFWAKMGLIVGLASRLTQANGIDRIPAVREELGRLAALEATIAGLVAGQIEACEAWPEGFVTPNRRMMYAALNWCQENHSAIIDALRTLLGALPLQMPASIDVLSDPALRDRFERWWKTPSQDALRRLKLAKLAWDLTGSEFAGRHQLYEKFYAGNSIIVRNQSDREAPWDKFHAIADGLLDRVEIGA